MNVLLARAGHTYCQTLMRSSDHGTFNGQLFSYMTPASTQAMATRFNDPLDMLAELVRLQADLPASRLCESAAVGTAAWEGMRTLTSTLRRSMMSRMSTGDAAWGVAQNIGAVHAFHLNKRCSMLL